MRGPGWSVVPELTLHPMAPNLLTSPTSYCIYYRSHEDPQVHLPSLWSFLASPEGRDAQGVPKV